MGMLCLNFSFVDIECLKKSLDGCNKTFVNLIKNGKIG